MSVEDVGLALDDITIVDSLDKSSDVIKSGLSDDLRNATFTRSGSNMETESSSNDPDSSSQPKLFPQPRQRDSRRFTFRKTSSEKDISGMIGTEDVAFVPPDAGTPAAEALAANAAIKVNKVTKHLSRKWRGMKRPKMKNLNIVKQLKKHTKQKRKKHHFSRNFKGKVIEGVHELYALTMGMMLGIRCLIGNAKEADGMETLTLDDFNKVSKQTFPPQGSQNSRGSTPPHQLRHTFKFKSYSPLVFKRIREFFGIDVESYMMSVCGNYNYLEFISNSKSGQFFFYSHDGKYMIKTQTKEEVNFMKRILPHYFKFVTENPHTMLVRLLGMHRVKMYHLRRKVHFVIMTSVFDTPQKIHTIYDLKGSLVGRESTPKEREEGGVLKDMDLIKDKRKLHLGEKKEMFLAQLTKDSEFLATLNIMDYSLLLGIHDRKIPDEKTAPQLAVGGTAMHSNTPFRRAHLEGMMSPGLYREDSSSSSDEEDEEKQANADARKARKDAAAAGGGGGDPGKEAGVKEGDRKPRSPAPGNTRKKAGGPTISTPEGGDPDAKAAEFLSVQAGGAGPPSPGRGGDSTGKKRHSQPRQHPHQPQRKQSIPHTAEQAQPDAYPLPSTPQHHQQHHPHFDATKVRVYDSAGQMMGEEEDDDEDFLNDSDDYEDSDGFEEGEPDDDDNDSEGDSVFGEVHDGGGLLRASPNLIDLVSLSRRANSPNPQPLVRTTSVNSIVEMVNSLTDGVAGLEMEANDGSGVQGPEGAHVAKLFRSAESLRALSQKVTVRNKEELDKTQKRPTATSSHVFTFGPGFSMVSPWTSRHDGGVNSRTPDGQRGDEIYYVGVIDILQQYNLHKRAENFFKGFTNDKTLISAVDANTYAKRFVEFIRQNSD